MMIGGRNIKKRYIIGGLVVLFLLVKCTGNDNPEPQQAAANLDQYNNKVMPGQYDNGEQAPFLAQPGPAPAAQPVIINNQPASHDSGFWQGMFFGMHFGGGSRGGDYSSSHRTVINKTYTTNHYSTPKTTAIRPTPVQPVRKAYTPPARPAPVSTYQPKARSSSWSSRPVASSRQSYASSRSTFGNSRRSSVSRRR